MKNSKVMDELLKRSVGNKTTCDRCKKTTVTFHDAIIDDDSDEIIVLCKECFRKHGYEYANIDKSKLH